MNPPFEHSYWAVPGKIVAGNYPGSIDPSKLDNQLTNLMDAGVTLVVNLMDLYELELFQRFFETYETVLPRLAEARGHAIRMERFPIQDRSIPTVDQMESIQKCIRTELEAGGIVYVHCLGGIGRTGTVIGCYFVEQGEADPLTLLRSLTAAKKEYFWPTPQTEEQRQFVLNWKPADHGADN